MGASSFEDSPAIELQMETGVPTVTPGDVLLGVLTAINHSGSPVVSFPQLPGFDPIAALATIPVLPQHIGRQVALLFTQGPDPRPIVIGFLYSPLQQLLDDVLNQSVIPVVVDNPEDQTIFDSSVTSDVQAMQAALTVDTVHVDGKRVVLEGQDELVLKCGEASITLTSNGRVVIRGKYLLSRSSGVNRILGGSVQVN